MKIWPQFEQFPKMIKKKNCVQCQLPIHYLNQSSLIVSWTLRRNKFQWNLNQNLQTIPFKKMHFKIVICKMAASILFLPQCIDPLWSIDAIWLVAWWHQAITWTNVDQSSERSCGIHLRQFYWKCWRQLSLIWANVWKLTHCGLVTSLLATGI